MILMVLFTSVLQVNGSDFPQYYPLYKALESALITEETLFTMRQVFFPVARSSAQETQLVRLYICVETTVDKALNSTTNDSCNLNVGNIASSNKLKVSSKCWKFLWTDSALVSLITN